MKNRRGRRADATGRSNGDGHHVRMHEYLLGSPAYRSLDCYARCLLVELYRLYRPGKNGSLFMSVRIAAELLSVSPQTAARSFHDLAERGFIRARQRGDFDWKARHATTWVLTEFDFAGGTATKEFMRWQLAPENQNTVLPRRQSVSPRRQPVLPDRQGIPETPPSVSPQEQIRPKTPSICLPRDTHTVTRGEGRSGAQSMASAAPRTPHADCDDSTLQTINDALASIINLNRPRSLKRRGAS